LHSYSVASSSQSNPPSSHKFSWLDLVHVTPHPGFSRLNRTDQRVLRFVEVFGGVLVLGRIAAAHMSANQAQAQVDPGVSGFHAIFTHVLFSVSELDLVKVAAFVWHRFLLDEKPQF
jgi:hypothetical protein